MESAYQVKSANLDDSKVITTSLFGANYVTTYDFEFSNNSAALNELAKLGIANFRFPGGSVTESIFADTSFLTGNWEATEGLDENGNTRTLTPIAEMLDVAADQGASVQLVVPTRVAFSQSAGQALFNGTYGERQELATGYLENVERYINHALAEATDRGVSISRLEIGNEFWGSGRMTAAEYGWLAAKLTDFLTSRYPGLDIAIQVAASANRFSPLADRAVLLEPTDGEDYIVHTVRNLEAVRQPGWHDATIPGSGNAATQTQTIAEAISQGARYAHEVDGIVGHVYFDAGFEGIDSQRHFSLGVVPEIFIDAFQVDSIDYFVTEWSPRNPLSSNSSDNLGNANGIHYAHSVVEAFYELAEYGIDSANFWPLTFGSPNQKQRTLIDTVDNDLTFGGAAMSWLSQTMVGLAPLDDFEVQGSIDIHTFGNEERYSIIVSERSGSDLGEGTHQVRLDVSELGQGMQLFVSVTSLYTNASSLFDDDGDVIFTHHDGFMTSDAYVDIGLSAYEMAKIDIYTVTSGRDDIQGTSADDMIHGAGGNDHLHGDAGDDQINGGEGNDALHGEDGNDTIAGGSGNDRLVGAAGDDWISAGAGNDRLEGGHGNDWLLGEDGNDIIFSGPGIDFLSGGSGDDTFIIDARVKAEIGWVAYNIGSSSQIGTGQYLPLDSYRIYEGVIDGGLGYDVLRLGNNSSALFLDNTLSAVPGGVSANSVRLTDIEEINGEGGDDIIDLTSAQFGPIGGTLKIDGGEGNDVIWGTHGDEYILGGAGDDQIFSGSGNDTVSGGRGADTFEFTASSRAVTVLDFNVSEGDRLLFYNVGGFQFAAESLSLEGEVLSLDLIDREGQKLDVLQVQLEGFADLPEPHFDDFVDFIG
ncbi:hypothetical protein JANAI62_37700 [Jannaschia pagri]|uniref:Hemolysin-type calcium-binding repeat-containing protein n=1 Tax=Jannaschia pagri TaxID=2829797 RepID=A0ABQ4NRV9_9RHOB|nr:MULTISPECIES: calcium-binding protein [unclassified Jannaschia]GIT93323.1 hypothetical protein JANAI61_37810 [Jannaschia sp. AI_61]GIT97147.1 hypothetical protein JANAI62_37700 [Jannaschia sp. AI_62]